MRWVATNSTVATYLPPRGSGMLGWRQVFRIGPSDTCERPRSSLAARFLGMWSVGGRTYWGDPVTDEHIET